MKKTARHFAVLAAVGIFAASLSLPIESLAKGFSGGGSRSFSSPSRSFSAPSRPSYSPPPSQPHYTAPASPTPSPQRFTAPSPSQQVHAAEPEKAPRVTTPKQPAPAYVPKNGYDADAGTAAKEQRSRAAYKAANPSPEQPAAERSAEQTPSSRYAARDLSYKQMEQRQERQQSTFGRYYNAPAPIVVYHDNFNPWFWMYMMDRSSHDRAEWYYHHSDEIDPARIADLRAHDAEFDQRLQALEQHGIKKDAGFAPQGIDRDLMYNDETVHKAYVEKERSGFPWGWVIGIMFLLGLGYLIFGVRFKLKS